MILYNMTINIDEDIKDHWLDWMKNDFIPLLINNPLVLQHRFYRLLTEVEGQGITYSVQLFFDTHSDFEHFDLNFFPNQLERIYQKYSGKFVEFRSILETVA